MNSKSWMRRETWWLMLHTTCQLTKPTISKQMLFCTGKNNSGRRSCLVSLHLSHSSWYHCYRFLGSMRKHILWENKNRQQIVGLRPPMCSQIFSRQTLTRINWIFWCICNYYGFKTPIIVLVHLPPFGRNSYVKFDPLPQFDPLFGS